MKTFEGDKPELAPPSTPPPPIVEANDQRSRAVFDPTFKLFQYTPTTQTYEVHCIYLTLCLMDFIELGRPLTPSC